MRTLLIVLGLIISILGLLLSVFPVGSIVIIPIVLAFIIGLLAFYWSKKENKGTLSIRIMFLIIIVSLGLVIYNSLQPNEVAPSSETQNSESTSEEVPLEELEGIEIDQ